MRSKNDILLKGAFEESFPDLLRFHFPDADQIFDMDRGFEFMDKELREVFPELEKPGGSRFADMLVKTFLRNGEEEWILVHLEIQGEDTRNFAKRMFTYWYRIYDRFEVDILAMAIFTGGENQKRPEYFHKEFLGTEILYKYNVYHILDHTEEQLLAMKNPFGLIVLAAQKVLLKSKLPEQQLAAHRLTIARALVDSKKYESEQIKRFLFFLKTFIHIENPEINNIFDKQTDLLTGTTNAMGIIDTIKMLTLEEGMEKGMEVGMEKGEQKKNYEVTRNLLLNTDLSNEKIAALVGVSESFVKEVFGNINR